MPFDQNVAHAQEVGATNLLYHAVDLRRLQLALIGGSPHIGGGVARPNALAVTPGGGLTLSVAEGGCWVGSTSPNHGLWFGYNDGADTSQTLDTADASHARYDRLYVQVLEDAYDSTGVNTVGFGRVKGVADGNLNEPALPAGRVLELARVTVGAGVTNLTQAAILDRRPYLPVGTPVGTVKEYYGAVLPVGYLWANGQAVSRTTYAALFAIIGTTYGAGDTSTTFNVPDRRGTVAVGADNLPANPGFPFGPHRELLVSNRNALVGTLIGEENHTLTINELASHGHLPADPNAPNFVGHASSSPSYQLAGGSGLAPGFRDVGSTANAGGGGAHNNMQPSTVCNFIIAV